MASLGSNPGNDGDAITLDSIRRFHYRAYATIVLWFINGLIYALVFRMLWVAIVSIIVGLLICAIAYWVSRNPKFSRIKVGITSSLSLSAAALLVNCLFTGLNDSPLIWYVLLFPVLTAYLHSMRFAILSAAIGLGFLGGVTYINVSMNSDVFYDYQKYQTLLVQTILLITLTGLAILSRKAAERCTLELNLSREEAEAAKQEAMEASKAKSDFLANMSHEIRTPLNGVIGVNRLLKDTILNEEQQSLLDMGMIASESLLHLVNEILDLSKIEAGKMELEIAPFQLSQVIASVVSLQQDSASRKGLTIDCTSSLPPELRLMGDALRLRQIILNLVSNAIKFTSTGRIGINCFEKSLAGDQKCIRVEIVDSGPGMSSSDQNRLFSAYSQTDKSISRKYGGTGLGLAISQQLTELMHGEIGANSTLGEGSTFWIEIPFLIGESNTLDSPVESDNHAIENFEAYQGSVLVAEDNSVNQLIIRKLIEKTGLQVTIVDNGAEVLNSLQAQSFDLVILDCQMPVMDGYEACHAIRSSGNSYSGIPIIALTASALKEDEKKCMEAGMNDFLTKPVDPKKLYESLSSFLH